MPSNVPVIRQLSWLSLVPQLLLIALTIYLYHLGGFEEAFLLGALTYSLIAFLLRTSIAKHHRMGMRLVKQQNYKDAIPYFEKSVEYFSKNNWVDKYRYITLLSSSKMTYKEMGLCNIAFCYSQTGNGPKAKEYYEQALRENPVNGIAVAGINMLQSVDTKES